MGSEMCIRDSSRFVYAGNEVSEQAVLALSDGTTFWGRSIGAQGRGVGEVVFNTAITGYQEILSDPSYAQQIVTLTYPHIGNTGVNEQDLEASRLFASGLVVRDASITTSNWRSERALDEYLKDMGVVAISDIDTRKLTRLLCEKGAQNGCISAGSDFSENEAVKYAVEFPGLKGADLAKMVTTSESYSWRDGSWDLSIAGYRPLETLAKTWRVVAYDFGIKRNILRLLAERGCEIEVVPANEPAAAVVARRPQGVFLSNGPGDPEPCDYAIAAIREIVRSGLPVFGICLGHQLLALACGARTSKMKFGHHGANHPVREQARASH